MVREPKPRLIEQVDAPQHHVPSTARENRAQSVHRLQIGLFGLAAMLLLVGLANIIMDRARLTEDRNAAFQLAPGAPVAKKPGSDPLADIGVVPAADPTATGTNSVKP